MLYVLHMMDFVFKMMTFVFKTRQDDDAAPPYTPVIISTARAAESDSNSGGDAFQFTLSFLGCSVTVSGAASPLKAAAFRCTLVRGGRRVRQT